MIELEIFDGQGQPWSKATTLRIPGPGPGQGIHEYSLDSLKMLSWGMRVQLIILAEQLDDWVLGSAQISSIDGMLLNRLPVPVFFRHGADADAHPTDVVHFKVPISKRDPYDRSRVTDVAWEGWHMTIRGVGA